MARTTRKDDVELQKASAKKLARTLVRLKFSIMADQALNDIIPDIDDSVDAALTNGTDWSFDVEALVAQLGA